MRAKCAIIALRKTNSSYYSKLVELNKSPGKRCIFSNNKDKNLRTWTHKMETEDRMNRINMNHKQCFDLQHATALLNQALPKLDDESAKAIYLRYWESKSIAEIAKAIDRSWDYTNNLLEKTLLKLRGEIQKLNNQQQLNVA